MDPKAAIDQFDVNGDIAETHYDVVDSLEARW